MLEREQAPHEYGDRHAAVYDRIYGSRFASRAAVDALARAAGGGRVLELGLGTGRLAIPLAARGVPVDGIEGSQAMVARLRSQPGASAVGVFVTDLAGFELPIRGYAVAVCAVSTLFMLPGPGPQQRCIGAAARHLRLGGELIIEAFRPDPSRFDATGHRTEQRATIDGTAHQVRSRHDPAARAIHITHILTGDGGSSSYEVTLYYAAPEQIDAMATAAGLTLRARWHDWNASPATSASRDPISVYRRERMSPPSREGAYNTDAPHWPALSRTGDVACERPADECIGVPVSHAVLGFQSGACSTMLSCPFVGSGHYETS